MENVVQQTSVQRPLIYFLTHLAYITIFHIGQKAGLRTVLGPVVYLTSWQVCNTATFQAYIYLPDVTKLGLSVA